MLLLASIVLAAAAGDWVVPEARYRIRLSLPSPGEGVRAVPFVLTGQEFYLLTGSPPPPTAALWLTDGKARIPHQIDERDGDGRLRPQRDGRFDGEDELVFVATLSASTPATYDLYWSLGKPSEPLETRGESLVKTEKPGGREKEYVSFWLRTDRLRVAVGGTGAPDPTAHKLANYARGTLAYVELDGWRVNHITSSWGFFLPRHPFGDGPGKFRWSAPTVVVDGPVRTVVESERRGAEWKDKQKRVFLRGDVVSQIIVYGSAPVVDVQYRFRYAARSDKWSASFGFPMRIGRTLDAADVLMVPLLDRVYRRRVTPHHVDEAWYPTFYSTPVPEQGWFAWFDSKERRGLAVFYEKMDTITNRAKWVSHRPVKNPEIRLRTHPGGTCENSVVWRYRGLTTNDLEVYPIRLVGLTAGTDGELLGHYQAWGAQLRKRVRVSLPTKRP